jgi:subtilisin family serine protease/nitrogen fixation-related uncharacterized protein
MVKSALAKVALYFVLLAALIAAVKSQDYADHDKHAHKIILTNEIIDTEREKGTTFENAPKDTRLRQYLVHVKEDLTRPMKLQLEKELGEYSETYYVPHNTYVMITTLQQMKEAATKHKDKILWVSEVKKEHKLSEDLFNELVGGEIEEENKVVTSRQLDVFVSRSKRQNTTQIAAEWERQLNAAGFKVKTFATSTEKIIVSVLDKSQKRQVIEWIAANPHTKHVQKKEEFTVLQEELTDDPLVLADMDPLSEEYKTLVLSTATVLQSENEKEWIGQPGLPDVQFLWSKGLDGEGEVLGVGDTGIDHSHCSFHDPNGTMPFDKVDLKGHRKFASYWRYADDKDAVNGHGTHVASIAVAHSDEQPMFDGVIRKAKISFIDIGLPNLSLRLPPDLSTDYFPLVYKTTPIVSNSWGNRRYGQYTMAAREIDDFSFKHRDFLALYAAGNSGRSGGATITPPGTAKNALTTGAVQGTFRGFQMGLPLYADLLKNQMRDHMCSSTSVLYDTESFCGELGQDAPCSTSSEQVCNAVKTVKDCCSSPFLKKFCCVKDLLQKLKKNPNLFNPRNVAVFSSRGPTKDNRIKPELLAHGQPVFGARSDGTTGKYHCPIPIVMQGTSQATPVMASFAIMARQYYKKGFYPSGKSNPADGFVPSGALLKATLINSGTNMEGKVDLNGQDSWVDLRPMPSFTQGFGRVQLTNTLYFAESSNFTLFKEEKELNTGERHEFCFQVNTGATKSFKSTLVWMDYPGSPSAAIALVNNLDLRVLDQEGHVLYGNGGVDYINNVEQVMVAPNQASGKTYKVTVKGSKVPQGPQPYALVVTGQLKKVDCAKVTFAEPKDKLVMPNPEKQQQPKKKANDYDEEFKSLIKQLLSGNE